MLLISVDGMHQQDLAWYVRHYPHSALAGLVRHGIEYSDALTTIPSDSFPATVGLMTGGDPGVTGFYYDDTYNYDVFPPGTKKCVGRPPGAEVNYDETDDVNPNRLDAGQGLKGLPGSILQMTSNLRAVQADLPEPVPQGQHDLQRRPAGRPADCLVRQAPVLPRAGRAVGQRRRGLLHPRD